MSSKTLSVLALALVLAACAPRNVAQLPLPSAYTYHVGSGDVLRVTVYREAALSGEFPVSGSGGIALPLIGEIAVAGGSLEQAHDAIVRALSARYIDPQVTVETVRFRPVFILGEVSQPGEYEYRERMTVTALVAKAGGFRYRANKKIVFIRHENSDAEAAFRLTSGALLQPGDVVRVGATVL